MNPMENIAPSSQVLDSQPIIRPAPRRLRGTGCCNRFIIDDNGTISISLRDQSIFACVSMTAFLVFIGTYGCYTGEAVCDDEHFPMISDFLKLQFYDRIFCLLSTFLCLSCMLGNIRAVYSMLYPICQQTKDSSNDILFWLGLVGSFALPMVGFFDETIRLIHGASAVTFFICYTAYAFWLLSLMNKYKDQLTVEQQSIIPTLKWTTGAIIAAGISFVTSYLIWGTVKPYFAYLEWTLTLLLINFFSFVSFDNDYYQSVHRFAEK